MFLWKHSPLSQTIFCDKDIKKLLFREDKVYHHFLKRCSKTNENVEKDSNTRPLFPKWDDFGIECSAVALTWSFSCWGKVLQRHFIILKTWRVNVTQRAFTADLPIWWSEIETAKVLELDHFDNLTFPS